MKEAYLLEKVLAKQVAGPVDANTAAITGARFDMKGFDRVAFLVSLAAGTTTSAHLFSLKQHNAASSGTSKAVAVTNPYYHKIGAATSFTKVDVTVAEDEYDLHSILADSASMVVFEVLAEDLDVNNGFRWVSLDIADSGGAQLCSVVAVGHNCKSLPAYEIVA